MAKKKSEKSPQEKEAVKKEFAKKAPGVIPHPAPEEDRLKHIGVKEKIKRQRRTDEEIQKDLETAKIREDGFDTIAIFFKSLSDNDAAQYGLTKQPKEFFYPIAKNYAKILNYFLPKAKAIYFVITMTAFQSWTMIKARADLINAKRPKEKKPPGKDEFPTPEETKPEQVK